MDTNGLRFWMLAEEDQWHRPGNPPPVEYDQKRRSLRLASQRPVISNTATTLPNAEALARTHLEIVPQTRDSYENRAYWDAASKLVMATGAFPDSVAIFAPIPGEQPTDLAMGYDGVLYLAIAGKIVMQDRRDRWMPVTLAAENLTAWRLAADPKGGVWVLDRTRRQLARVQGMPLPDRGYTKRTDQEFGACQENPDPPRIKIWSKAVLPNDEEPVAIAGNDQGDLAILTWKGDRAYIRCLNQAGSLTPAVTLLNARYPYSLTWVGEDRIAVLVPDLPTEALVYAIVGSTDIAPVGDFYPLQNYREGSFLHGVSLPPHYPTTSGSSPLYPISFPTFAVSGEAFSGASKVISGTRKEIYQTPLDSGNSQTIWHRLYLEAAIPPTCGIQIYLAATDTLEKPQQEWYEHRFGDRFAPADDKIPRAAWLSSASEIPYHPGLLHCPPEKNRAGLFVILIQRANRKVRSLQGRYLWVRVQLSGDGRTTPELAALRVYASRFSYVERYLPELYRETIFGKERDEIGSSTPADFLERFLCNFESILTPLEDQIANSYLLTDPRTTSTEALEWLGSWISVNFDPAYPPPRRRHLLEATPELYRKRGTLAGLKLALDIATGGAVRGGEIIVLEDFRLRRTFATILGADLADETDPLLAGLAVSGNSYVGDSLILGDETRQEFLAIYRADLEISEMEAEAIAAFFDRLAYRVTVFVHQDVEPQDLGLIQRVVDLETPAHVLSRVVTASYPLMVGIASLIGVDTYLSQKPKPQPVKLGQSQIGIRDLILRPPSLDPRLEAETYDFQRPAAIGKGAIAESGTSIQLDGSTSIAPSGRTLVRYIWTPID